MISVRNNFLNHISYLILDLKASLPKGRSYSIDSRELLRALSNALVS